MSAANLLHYRPWQGKFAHSAWNIWPIARVALMMVLRRKLFWGLYAFALLIFLIFFFGQYLLAWAETQMGAVRIPVGMGVELPREMVMKGLRDAMKLNGSAEMYRTFFWWQGYMVMVLLALAGSILVGNDFHHGSLPFYLAKPLGPWQYLLGKCLAVGLFVNLITTLPALVLFFQYRVLYEWGELGKELTLLAGIVGYGLVLTVFLSLMLVAAASWLRRTVPLIMAWTGMFLFLRFLSQALVDALKYDARWRLIDLWNNTYLVGNACLGLATESIQPAPQPAWPEAALVLGVLCIVCLTYLSLRIRAVEVVK
jgi:ABC-type transport system involved in multi-copper enzyme maturation permease subunit